MKLNRSGWTALAALLVLAAYPLLAADEHSDEVIRQAEAAMAQAMSLRADFEYVAGTRTYTGSAVLERPNLARIEIKGYPTETVVSDGTNAFSFQPARNEYTKTEVKPDGSNITILLASHLRGFFVPDPFIPTPEGATVTTRRESVEGVQYDVVQVAYKPSKFRPVLPLLRRAPGAAPQPAVAGAPEQTSQRTMRYYVALKDRMIYRVVSESRIDQRPPVTATLTITSLQLNAPNPKTAFQWTPPATAKLQAPRAPVDYLADLVPLGKPVPDFQLPQPGGGALLSLHSEARKNKATLVNFWFRNCGPCQREMPKLQEIYQELKGKGFEIVAVNRGDTEDVITQFFTEQKFSFRPVMGGIGEQYTVGKAFGVRAYPTNYLLDSQGKVLWRGVGYGANTEKELRDEIGKALRSP